MRQPSLLILGAGSSKDFGFPLGTELVNQIANALRFDAGEFRLNGGNEQIRSFIQRARMHQPELFEVYLNAADHISRSIYLSSSIDRFLESNRDKAAVPLLGKLAISEEIAGYEARSPLFVEEHRSPYFDTATLAKTWLAKLFALIHTNKAEGELGAVFENLRIVTLNYDRTFEQFIIIALTNFYKIPVHRAHELLKSIHITHVYGSLGDLTRGPNYQPFGSCADDPEVTSNRIRTFHETVDDAIIAEINDSVQWCKRIYILGFSFGEMNMGLLEACKPEVGLRPVFATNYGLSNFNSEIARDRLDRIFCKNHSIARLFDVESARFFDEIQLAI